MIYGGDWNTLVHKFGLSPEVAKRAEESFLGSSRASPRHVKKTFDAFFR